MTPYSVLLARTLATKSDAYRLFGEFRGGVYREVHGNDSTADQALCDYVDAVYGTLGEAVDALERLHHALKTRMEDEA